MKINIQLTLNIICIYVWCCGTTVVEGPSPDLVLPNYTRS